MDEADIRRRLKKALSEWGSYYYVDILGDQCAIVSRCNVVYLAMKISGLKTGTTGGKRALDPDLLIDEFEQDKTKYPDSIAYSHASTLPIESLWRDPGQVPPTWSPKAKFRPIKLGTFQLQPIPACNRRI